MTSREHTFCSALPGCAQFSAALAFLLVFAVCFWCFFMSFYGHLGVQNLMRQLKLISLYFFMELVNYFEFRIPLKYEIGLQALWRVCFYVHVFFFDQSRFICFIEILPVHKTFSCNKNIQKQKADLHRNILRQLFGYQTNYSINSNLIKSNNIVI